MSPRSVEAAVAKARELAGDRDVSIAGATITRGCLDGYVTGPHNSADAPMGIGGFASHRGGNCVVLIDCRSSAAFSAKRAPVPGWTVSTVDLPGVLAPARASRVCLLGAFTVQRLAELAFQIVLGIFRLRRRISHSGLLPWKGYIQSLAHLTQRCPAPRVVAAASHPVLCARDLGCKAFVKAGATRPRQACVASELPEAVMDDAVTAQVVSPASGAVPQVVNRP